MKPISAYKRNSLIVFGLPLLVRLPLMIFSYGIEEDAWGHVLNGLQIAESGAYIISRLPGHPLMEALSYLLWISAGNTYWIWNLPFTLAASWAGLEFFRILLHFKLPNSLWLAVAFSFVPIILFSGATVMDYSFQLALTLAAYRSYLKKRLGYIFLFLSLAIGFRLTSALFLLPLLLGLKKNKASFKELALIGILTPAIGLSFYLPAYLDLGIAFFNTYPLPYPPIAKAIYKGSVGAFGTIGFFSLLSFGIIAFLNRNKKSPVFWWWIIILHLILYLRIPEKSAFLIPLTPFLLLLISQQLQSHQIKKLSILLIVSPFILGINLIHPLRGSDKSIFSWTKTISDQEIGIDLLYGPYDAHLTKRKNKKEYVESLIQCKQTDRLQGPIITGWWYAMLEILDSKEGDSRPNYHYYLPPEEIDKAKEMGLRIFALPEQAKINARKYGYDESAVAVNDYPCP